MNTFLRATIKGIGRCALFCAASGAVLAGDPSPEEKLAVIKARVRMAMAVPDAEMSVTALAGCYANPGPTMRRLSGGGLAGSDLYLFPDASYISVEWGDVQPATVNSKGNWTVTNSVARLTDDGSVGFMPERETSLYLAVTLTNTAYPRFITNTPLKRIVLLGAEGGYNHITSSKQRGDWELLLLIVGLEQVRPIRPEEVAEMRRQIMSDSWRPDFFGKHKDIQPTNAPYSSSTADSKR
jgi:hypothetical protein